MNAESVTTQEAEVQVAGETFQRIRVDGRDYFMKVPRPGSSLVEIWCRQPDGAVTAAVSDVKSLKAARRSTTFVQQLADGCAPKQGLRPDRFTFEQGIKKPATTAAATPTPKPFGARHFPPETDPHVLPDQVSPATEFPDSRF